MSHHVHINITLLLTSLHIISLSHQPHISIKSLRNHFHTRCHITNMHLLRPHFVTHHYRNWQILSIFIRPRSYHSFPWNWYILSCLDDLNYWLKWTLSQAKKSCLSVCYVLSFWGERERMQAGVENNPKCAHLKCNIRPCDPLST